MTQHNHLMIIDFQPGVFFGKSYLDLHHKLFDTLPKLRAHNTQISWIVTGNPAHKENALHPIFRRSQEYISPLLENRDEVFYKPRLDVNIEEAINKTGQNCLDILHAYHSGPSVALAGGTLFGCVLGCAQSLERAGLSSFAILDLTDEPHMLEQEKKQADYDSLAENLNYMGLQDYLRQILPNQIQDQDPPEP